MRKKMGKNEEYINTERRYKRKRHFSVDKKVAARKDDVA